MLKYEKLTPFQKRWINEAVKYKDVIQNFPVMTLKEQTEIQKRIRADHLKRKTGIRIGRPDWINVEGNKFAKGKYYFPAPPENNSKNSHDSDSSPGISYSEVSGIEFTCLTDEEFEGEHRSSSALDLNEICRETGISIPDMNFPYD